MDQIEPFLLTLLGNSPERYRSVAETALGIYRDRGQLTVKLHAWALKAARAQRVDVPDAFHKVPVFEPASGGYVVQHAAAAAPHAAAGPVPSDEREIIAEALLTTARALVTAAERLRGF